MIVLKRAVLTFLMLVVVVGCSQSPDPSNDETTYADCLAELGADRAELCQTLANVPKPSGFEVDLSQFDDRTRNEARDLFDATLEACMSEAEAPVAGQVLAVTTRCVDLATQAEREFLLSHAGESEL